MTGTTAPEATPPEDPTTTAAAADDDELSGDELGDDTAGEVDDSEPADAGDTTDDDLETGPVFAGLAVGGPCDARMLVSRYPHGILLVDRPGGRAWVYDYTAGQFIARPPAPLDNAGRWRAAEEPNYDVRAYDPEFTGDELVPVPA